MIVVKPLLQLHILILIFFLHASGETNSIYPGQSILPNQRLTSRNGVFELVLYLSDINSDDYPYYASLQIGIINSQTAVWKLDTELDADNLTMTIDGDLILYGYSQGVEHSSILWRSKTSLEFNSTKLILEDNGNLMIRSISNPEHILWQSFDHPTDTWLPGAKVSFNKLNNYSQPYGSGIYSFEMDPMSQSSITLKKNGTRYGNCNLRGIYFSCSLNLGWYSGEADMLLHDHTIVSYISNENETYLTYTMTNPSILTRFTIDNNGYFSQLMWLEEYKIWKPSRLRLADTYCNKFAAYDHKIKHGWSCSSATNTNSRQQSTPGSISHSLLQCHGGDKLGFLLLRNASIADLSQTRSPKKCKMACLQNCTCQAYVPDYQGVCLMWNQSSLKLQHTPGFDLYYRLATTKIRKTKVRFILPVSSAIVGGIILLITFGILAWKCRNAKVLNKVVIDGTLILYKYGALRRATKNFCTKLGEGGFGSVYKGNLPNSPKGIAVKYIKVHHQQEKQFRAEVSTIGMIHHANLVRLLGFCVQGKKRFLIYEYMPHGSLDKHIFGDGSGNLDWRTRYQIVLGIAKALAYLHFECRECIIHCDIKPENILLDDEFNPKIADFGLAKLLGRDFSRVLTTMRGTRGYLAPEWISGLPITSKADVYSYGMMLFEIISGKRNWSIRISGENDYIPLQVMQTLMSDGEVMRLLDGKLEGNANSEEIIKVCRIAGWCIQEHEDDRISMMQVVRILEGTLEVVNPPIPRFLQSIAEIPEEFTAYHSCIVE